ncbi:secreted protein [Melampsora americana]|nr:secreted protein [Melampsora americana]
MHFSWVYTALALAATVSAGVLRDVSPVKQLAFRDVSPVNQLAVRDTIMVTETEVVTYIKEVTTYLQDCYGNVAEVTTLDEVTVILQKTITQITTNMAIDECGCQSLFQSIVICCLHTNDKQTAFESQVVAVFKHFQTLRTYIVKQYSADFSSYWKSFGRCFQSLVTLSSNLQIDIASKIKLSVGLDIGILGIHIGLGIGIGGGGGGRGGGIGIGIGLGIGN